MKAHTRAIASLALLLCAGAATAQDHDADWRRSEAPLLTDHVQLTFPDQFAKAGEAYFDPSTRWIIFQAVERPADGEEPSPHYTMYVARLEKDARGTITGIDEPEQVSAPNSANTCGFFDPTSPHSIIFGSTITEPKAPDKAGYQRGTSKYVWAFPTEMEVCRRAVPSIAKELGLKVLIPVDATIAKPVFERPGGYDAECGYSPDARFIVFASIDPETADSDLWVWDAHTNTQTPLVAEEGYDGGPFFSPDGKRICYRSDRRGNDLLQLFVADLAFDDSGAITGIKAEHQLTDDTNVNWAPFWHPSGDFLVFATSRMGHHNYEVFSIDVPPNGAPGGRAVDNRASKRVTHASGFDGLPVFSNDGQWMMWTSQRGEKLPDEHRPSSQIWVARVVSTQPE